MAPSSPASTADGGAAASGAAAAAAAGGGAGGRRAGSVTAAGRSVARPLLSGRRQEAVVVGPLPVAWECLDDEAMGVSPSTTGARGIDVP
mmetsp:Transcript_70539/g.189937  ORF Transcript_70539/g.189937 Transcript_70539/m.189937 type:complete len:90 (-) Transcript_70539:83-352(-)